MEFSEYLPIWDKLTKEQQQRIAEMVEYRKVKKRTHIHDSSAESREVVTRMLRYFQSEGMVKLTRGTIEIVGEKKLEALQDA